MKRLYLLLCLLSVLVTPLFAGTETPVYESVGRVPILTKDEFKTLEIIDMEGNQIKNFTYQGTMNSSRDEFLGLYVRVNNRLLHYVVRPQGGKPIKSISWKTERGARIDMFLNGKSIGEYFRDEEQIAQKGRGTTQSASTGNSASSSGGGRNTLESPPAKADAKSLFTKWSEKAGVSATYISQAMFKMIGKVPQIELDRPVDLSPVIQTLDGLYMLEFSKDHEEYITKTDGTKVPVSIPFSRNNGNGGLRKDILSYIDGNGYNQLMEKREGQEVTRLYIAGNDKTVTGFVLVRMDVDFNYGQFICIEGNIPQDKFKNIIANGIK